MANSASAIRRIATALLAFSFLAVTADAALAWSGGGGGGGPPPKDSKKIDPEKARKLRELQKKLQAELHLDNQKSERVRTLEDAQVAEMGAIMNDIPRDSAEWQSAENVMAQLAQIEAAGAPTRP